MAVVIAAINRSAQRQAVPAWAFASALLADCVEKEGDMDRMLDGPALELPKPRPKPGARQTGIPQEAR